jgi:hypothetical protein
MPGLPPSLGRAAAKWTLLDSGGTPAALLPGTRGRSSYLPLERRDPARAINIGWVGCWWMKGIIVALCFGAAALGLGCNTLLSNEFPYLVNMTDASTEVREDSKIADVSSDASVDADGAKDATLADALSDAADIEAAP